MDGTPSRTEQAHKDEVNIHHILKRFQKTGLVTHTNKHEGTYNDYVDAPDFQEAQQIIASANSLFESLPSSLRRKMDNDPQKFVDFMQNEDNRDEMAELGLSTAHLPDVVPTPTPTPTPEVTAPTEPPTPP